MRFWSGRSCLRRTNRSRMWAIALVMPLCMLGACSDTSVDKYKALADQYDVSIERDQWGIPHVLGARDVDAAFGLAFAQAEDNWLIIEETVRVYRGEMAAFKGADAAPVDFLVKWLRLQETIDRDYRRMVDPAMQAYLSAFADGLNYYAATHPERFDSALLPVTAEDLVTRYMLRHLLFYGFDETIRELNGPERARDVSSGPGVAINGVPVGSNAIAVGPSRSEDGHTRLVINSHQPLTGPVAWYEAHIRSNEGLDVMGGLFPGSPTMGVGFNADLAWGATVNKPDLVDVYVLEIDPEDPMRYRLDGAWQTLEQFDIAIRVKLFGPFYWTVHRDGLRSVHGPVLQTEHGTYAVRYAGMDELRQAEQWHAMSKARSVVEFRDALAQHRFASFNFVAADREGHIGFFHNAMIPDRAVGFDWTAYLPGDTSELIWDRYLPWAQMPSVIDPPSGFVLSTNQTPFMISEEGSNPSTETVRVQDGYQTRVTNRATRGLEMFEAFGSISASELDAIKHDNRYSPDSRAGRWLRRVIEAVPEDDAALASARSVLEQWDLATDIANTHAALGTCVVHAEWRTEQRGQPDPDPRETLATCAKRLLDATGSLTPAYGEVNRHVRGTFNEAVAGGPDTLRAIYGKGLDDDGFNTNTAGDGLYYVVNWDTNGNQTVMGVHPFGSATLETQSAHYADQASDYTNERMHQALFTDESRSTGPVRRYTP